MTIWNIKQQLKCYDKIKGAPLSSLGFLDCQRSLEMPNRLKILSLLMPLFLGAGLSSAQAAITQVDLTNLVNFNYDIGQPIGLGQGNTGTPAASKPFDLLDSTYGANNVWLGSYGGQSVDIKVDVANAKSVSTLMNTLYGQNNFATASLTFEGTGGASESFTLVGNTDIRDFNNWIWTNSINGTTTQEWWTNNLNPVAYDLSHRLDSQTFTLNNSFAGQTLTDIVVTAGAGSGYWYSQPMLFAANVTSGVPEPSTWATMLIGFASLGLASYRRRKTVHAA